MASAKSITEHPTIQAIEAWQRQITTPVNIPPPERLVSTIGGGMLAFSGLRRRDWGGAMRTMVGGLLLFRGITGHSFLYKALNINRADNPFPSINISSIPEQEGFRVQRTLTISRTPQELYTFWHNVENAPRYLPSIQSVQKINQKRLHWTMVSPTGQKLEWDVEITEDQPGRLIAWQMYGDKPMLGNGGRISFKEAPRQRGTMVTLEADFVGRKGLQNTLEIPLLGKVTGLVLESWVLETLRRFKALMEAGEVPTLAGQPAGRVSRTLQPVDQIRKKGA
jgi:uncharacterized membrane protein